jgi:hypothetical protein
MFLCFRIVLILCVVSVAALHCIDRLVISDKQDRMESYLYLYPNFDLHILSCDQWLSFLSPRVLFVTYLPTLPTEISTMHILNLFC